MSFNDSEEADKKYYILAEKLLNGTITPEEENDFSEWYDSLDEKAVSIPSSFAISEDELKYRMGNRIKKTIKINDGAHTYRMYRAAASVAAILILAIGIFLYSRTLNNEMAAVVPASGKGERLKTPEPGARAVLTLADGSTILLDDTKNGTITQQGATRVIKLKGGQLEYQQASDHHKSELLSFNTISTPAGLQYEIVLADDTRVWLNASSSLRFPTSFNGKQRRVELTGEGYFEIAKNTAMPFTVHVNGMDIAVLGTHFNVMAYDEAKEIKTTLLEGSVSVTKGAARAILKPGEQARLKKKEGTIQIARDVNIKQAIAWKNGEFFFENTAIHEVMTQISQWYDMPVVYEGNVQDVGFSGIIQRRKDVSQLLEILEATHKAHFRLSDNKIIVTTYSGNP